MRRSVSIGPAGWAARLCAALLLAAGCVAGESEEDPAAGSPEGGPPRDAPSALLSLGEEVLCGDPVACDLPLPCSDVTEEAGVAYLPPPPVQGEANSLVTSLDVEMRGGMVVADLSGDGQLDFLSTAGDEAPRYFRGDGAFGFEEVPAQESGLLLGGAFLHGASAADVDGDADLDLLLLARDRVLLLRNRGDGTFEDCSAALGVSAVPGRSISSAWADFDRDGDLDVYVTAHGAGAPGQGGNYLPDPDTLLVQQADGSFAAEPRRLPGEPPDGYGFIGGWFDADGDGWLDLYVANDLAGEYPDAADNVFFHNEGEAASGDPAAVLLRHAPEAGLDVALFSMGLATGDVDLDGDLDVHVSNAGPSFLGRNDSAPGGGPLFTDISLHIEDLNASPRGDISWGTEFFDHDNDGRLELFTAFGHMPSKRQQPGVGAGANQESQYDTLLHWNIEDGWHDIAPDVGLDDPAMSRTVVPADLDRDGFVDLFVWSLDRGPRLHHTACNENTWIRVDLRMPGTGNVHAIGARVEAWVDGWLRGVRELGAGSTGYSSSGPPELYFGLGAAERVTLAVRWPDGEWTVDEDLPVRRGVVLERPAPASRALQEPTRSPRGRDLRHRGVETP
jgi:hypothetical protein